MEILFFFAFVLVFVLGFVGILYFGTGALSSDDKPLLWVSVSLILFLVGLHGMIKWYDSASSYKPTTIQCSCSCGSKETKDK